MVMTPPGGDERSASLMLERLLLQAISSGASDVHLEPQEEKLRVRFRVDGVLAERPALPTQLAPTMTSRLKVLASLDIAEKRRPQDGGFCFSKGLPKLIPCLHFLETTNL